MAYWCIRIMAGCNHLYLLLMVLLSGVPFSCNKHHPHLDYIFILLKVLHIPIIYLCWKTRAFVKVVFLIWHDLWSWFEEKQGKRKLNLDQEDHLCIRFKIWRKLFSHYSWNWNYCLVRTRIFLILCAHHLLSLGKSRSQHAHYWTLNKLCRQKIIEQHISIWERNHHLLLICTLFSEFVFLCICVFVSI